MWLPTMREQDRQRQILAVVGSLPGVLAWRNQSGALRNARGQLVRFGSPGSPDIVVIVAGRFLGLEIKQPGKPLSARQLRWQAACRAAGGVYERVEDAEQALAVVRRAAREGSK